MIVTTLSVIKSIIEVTKKTLSLNLCDYASVAGALKAVPKMLE